MKYFILLSIVAISICTGCTNTNSRIEGNIYGGKSTKVYLDLVGINAITTIDSTTTSDNGTFKFSVNVEEDPQFYRIRLNSSNYIYILAEADSSMQLTFPNYDNFSKEYSIKGSNKSCDLKLVVNRLNDSRKSIDSLVTLIQSEKSQDTIQAYLQEYTQIFLNQRDFAKKFIISHTTSPISYFVLYQKLAGEYVLDQYQDLSYYRAVATGMDTYYPKAEYTKLVKSHTQRLIDQAVNAKLNEIVQNSAQALPSLELPDINGKLVDINNFKGHTIILDFAFITEPKADSYIAELKDIQNKYASKGVIVVQVCLDKSKLLWESAIKKYGIKWYCLRDENGSDSKVVRAWNIDEVPANYIIDKDFNIVGKNLFGRSLSDRLNDILK